MLVLTFQLAGEDAYCKPSSERFSAEAFEALVWMAVRTRKAGGEPRSFAGGQSLSAVYDPDAPGPFVRDMDSQVGSLLGDGGAALLAATPGPSSAAPSARCTRSSSAVPHTPVRNLGIS